MLCPTLPQKHTITLFTKDFRLKQLSLGGFAVNIWVICVWLGTGHVFIDMVYPHQR